AAARRPGHKTQPLPSEQLNPLLAMRGADALHAAAQPVGVVDQVLDAQEHLLRGLELVCAVEDQLLAKQVQPGQAPSLEDATLAVLPAHDDGALEGGPFAVAALAQAVDQAVLLPRVEHQA